MFICLRMISTIVPFWLLQVILADKVFWIHLFPMNIWKFILELDHLQQKNKTEMKIRYWFYE